MSRKTTTTTWNYRLHWSCHNNEVNGNIFITLVVYVKHMKKSKWLDCQGNEFFPKQKGTPSLVKIEHKNTASLDSAKSKKKSKVAVLQLTNKCHDKGGVHHTNGLPNPKFSSFALYKCKKLGNLFTILGNLPLYFNWDWPKYGIGKPQFQYFLGFSEKWIFFGGMKILWIFFWGHHKIGLVWGSFLCNLGSFLRSRYRIGILLGVAKISNIFWCAWNSWYFFGVNGWCWVRAYVCGKN